MFVTSVLSHVDADRKLSSTRAMWQRAQILLQDHPRIAGWTQTQLWYRIAHTLRLLLILFAWGLMFDRQHACLVVLTSHLRV